MKLGHQCPASRRPLLRSVLDDRPFRPSRPGQNDRWHRQARCSRREQCHIPACPEGAEAYTSSHATGRQAAATAAAAVAACMLLTHSPAAALEVNSPGNTAVPQQQQASTASLALPDILGRIRSALKQALPQPAPSVSTSTNTNTSTSTSTSTSSLGLGMPAHQPDTSSAGMTDLSPATKTSSIDAASAIAQPGTSAASPDPTTAAASDAGPAAQPALRSAITTSPGVTTSSTDSILPGAVTSAPAVSAPGASALTADEGIPASSPEDALSILDEFGGGNGTSSGRGALSALISEQQALSLPAAPAQYPDLPALAPLKIQQVALSNGLRVLLVEDHEVPLVKGVMLMKGGIQASPPNKVGLASLATAVQRAGGSVAHPGPVMDLQLEELAAYVESGSGSQVMSLEFFSGTEDLPQVVGLWAEVLRQPALPADRLAFFQDQVLNALEHKDDDPGSTARRELGKLLYGPDSIYARQPTKESITSVTLEDLRQWLDAWERPDSAVLGVVGDFNPASMQALLEQAVGDWAPAPGQPPQAPDFVREPDILAAAQQSTGKLFLIDRPGLTQASVAIGEPGVSLMDPDAYALDVLSTTLNSFGGQLFDQIRSREGLAYSVYGSWDTPPDRRGVFVGGGETSAPAEFISGMRRVLEQTTRTPPPSTLLEDARSQALNTFVFNFASKAAQLQRQLVYDLLGLPPDLLFRYRDAVSRVSAEDVLGAAQRHLHPDQQVTVVVADAKQVAPKLADAGFSPVPLVIKD